MTADSALSMPDKEIIRRIADPGANPAEKLALRRELDRRRDDSEKAHERRQRTRELAEALGPRYSPASTTLDGYEVYHPAQRPVLARVRAIIPELPKLVRAGRSLVFFGTIGTGKDYLLARLLYEALNAGLSAKWAAGTKVFGKDTWLTAFPGSGDVLGISDPVLPVGHPADWEMPRLHKLVDARYRARKSTWLTINAPTPDAIGEMLTHPVWDRLREGAELFQCAWPSYRERVK